MKPVLTLAESAELELLKNVLEEGGIHCVLKNADVVQALPVEPCHEELWVLKDEDLPRAQELCHDWFAPALDDFDQWFCPQCQEPLGHQFDSCWRCGIRRNANPP